MISIRTKSIRTNSIRTNSIRTKSIITKSIRTNSIRTNSIRTKSIRTNSIRTNSIRTNSIRTIFNPFTAIPFTAIPFTAIPFTAIPFTAIPFTAIPFTAIPFTAIPFTDIPFTAIPFTAIPFTAIPFTAIPFTAIPFTAIPFTAIPFTAIPFTAIPFTAIPFTAIPFTAIPFTAIPFTAIPFTAIPFIAIPFTAIPFTAIPFNAIPFNANVYMLNGMLLTLHLNRCQEVLVLSDGRLCIRERALSDLLRRGGLLQLFGEGCGAPCRHATRLGVLVAGRCCCCRGVLERRRRRLNNCKRLHGSLCGAQVLLALGGGQGLVLGGFDSLGCCGCELVDLGFVLLVKSLELGYCRRGFGDLRLQSDNLGLGVGELLLKRCDAGRKLVVFLDEGVAFDDGRCQLLSRLVQLACGGGGAVVPQGDVRSALVMPEEVGVAGRVVHTEVSENGCAVDLRKLQDGDHVPDEILVMFFALLGYRGRRVVASNVVNERPVVGGGGAKAFYQTVDGRKLSLGAVELPDMPDGRGAQDADGGVVPDDVNHSGEVRKVVGRVDEVEIIDGHEKAKADASLGRAGGKRVVCRKERKELLLCERDAAASGRGLVLQRDTCKPQMLVCVMRTRPQQMVANVPEYGER
jgi:hypothetical protein